MASMGQPRLVGPATLAELVRLERNARRPAEAVRADQLVRLQRALADARRAPFWAEHLARVDVPTSLEDLAGVPPIDRLIVQGIDERDRLTVEPPAASRSLQTSGTSGAPLRVHYSPRAAWWQGVLRLRSTRARELPIWGATAAIALRPRPRGVRGPVGALRWTRHVDVPVDASGAALDELLPRLDGAAVSGHPHLLVELAEALAGRVTLRAALTFGETLTPEVRADIRRLYGSGPLDTYGTAECGVVAWQCGAADLYHVNHEAVAVEIVDGGGHPAVPGQMGELLLTALWNPLMPFVRYRIGDAAAWATRPCRCGSRLPALTDLAGRTMSWIVDDDGRRVAPQRMWAALHVPPERYQAIRRYRVRQDADRRIRVEVVAGAGFGEEGAELWAASYRRLLGDVAVEIRSVDALVTPPGEKFEIISSAASPDGG
jgi:phenylacetate-CoA ligase